LNIEAYLRRINYTGRLSPDIETLRGLHQAHLMTVPFENLDIHLGRPINLDPDALFLKIVENRRGGFCYELNNLFARLLEHIGFKVTLLSARVYDADDRLGPEYDHMALLVTLKDRWLADVGFGDSSLFPLRLDDDQPQYDNRRAYRVSREDAFWYESRAIEDGAWKRDYVFTLQARRIAEYLETCNYHQTSPDSPFTQRQICTIATPTGRITLRGLPTEMKVIVTKHGVKRERVIADPAQVSALLLDQFGIAV